MILMAANIIKILIFLMACVLCWKIIGKKIQTKFFVLACTLILLFSIVAGYGSGLVPPLTDKIVLTATGEKNDAAKGSEIVLMGYTIDETEYVAGESLEISGGKWFWRGDEYIWRPKTDERQPDGVTQMVVIEIPVGWARTLNFSSNQWRGMVSIQAGDQTWIADTYADEDNSGTKNIAVGRSQTSLLIMNQIMKLGVYLIILGVLVGVSLVGFRYWTQIKSFSQKHVFAICLAGIAGICLVIQWNYASVQAFWGDELLQLSFSGLSSTLMDTIGYCQRFRDMTPPLYGILLNFWCRIVPYKETWLLLPSMLGVCGTVVLTGVLGKIIAGRKIGIIAAALTASSVHIIVHAGLELRCYGLFSFVYVLTLILFIKKHTLTSRAINVGFMICMTLTAYMHYIGVLCCGALFLIELKRFMEQKASWKFLLPYCGAGIMYVPWIVAMLPYITNRQSSWIQPETTILRLSQRINYLVSDNTILLVLLFIGSVAAFFLYRPNAKQNYYLRVLIASVWLIILGTYLFGEIGKNAITFNVDRYYICFIPQIMIICACSIQLMTKGVLHKSAGGVNTLGVEIYGLALIAVFFLNNMVMVTESVQTGGYTGYRSNYRIAANWLMEQNDIYSENTVIVMTKERGLVDAWNAMYLSQDGKRDAPNAISQDEFTDEIADQYDVVYYLFNEPAGKNKEALNAFEFEKEESSLDIYIYKRA